MLNGSKMLGAAMARGWRDTWRDPFLLGAGTLVAFNQVGVTGVTTPPGVVIVDVSSDFGMMMG